MKCVVTLLGVVALSGCAGTWTKAGATQEQLAQDMGQCRVEGTALHPVNLVARLESVRPTSNQCTGSGTSTRCVTVPGGPPQPVWNDDNASHRTAAINTCLQNRGYAYSRS